MIEGVKKVYKKVGIELLDCGNDCNFAARFGCFEIKAEESSLDNTG